MPAASSSGITSSRIRPLVRAITRGVSLVAMLISFTRLGLTRDTANLRAEGLHFFFNTFVTAVDMVNTVDYSFVGCDQASDNQAGRRPQVGRHYRRTV